MNDTLTLESADLLAHGNHPLFTFEGVPGLNPRTLQGQYVVIDGKRYVVLSVSTYAMYDPTGTPFGLMVQRA